MISAVSFVVVVVSYIIYKIKNAGQGQVQNQAEQTISSFTPDYSNMNIPGRTELQPVRIQKEPVYIHEKNFHPKKIAVKKPVQRFMVLNSQPQMQPVELAAGPAYYNYEAPFTRQSFNLYNNYSANSAEPLNKFGV